MTSPKRLGPDELEAQLNHLLTRYTVLPLSVLVDCLHRRKPFPRRAVALTVDDGYADFVEFAYPVFQRLGVPVTLYVTSRFVDGNLWLWWDAIRYLLVASDERECMFEFRDLTMRIEKGNDGSVDDAWNTLADLGVQMDPDSRDDFIDALQRDLHVDLPDSPTKDFSAARWSQLRDLDPAVVEIGAHTSTHPILSKCSNARLRDEIFDCKSHIVEKLGRPVRAFCYPNGQPDDVDDRCRALVREAGFDSAVMACGGFSNAASNPFALERMPAPHSTSDFCAVVAGVPRLRRGFLKRRGANTTRF